MRYTTGRMNKVTTLILVRHGETSWNAKKKLQGIAKVPLNAIGRAQAQATGKFLAHFPIDVIYSSPLARAMETARAIQKRHPKTKLITEDLLLERQFGLLEGRMYDEVFLDFPRFGFEQTWFYPFYTPGGSEALVDVLKRAKKFIEKILSDQQGKTVVVISHGIAIRCIVSAAVGIPLVSQTHLWLDNGSVSLIQHTKNTGWDIHFFNFTGHLTGLGGIKRG